MSLFSRKVGVLLGERNKEIGDIREYEKLFAFLRSLINRQDLVSRYFKLFDSLKKGSRFEFVTSSIPLYLSVEDFLLNNRPIVVKREFGREGLHTEIKKIIDIEKFDEKFRLLFYNQNEQIIHLFEIYIQDIAQYFIENLGVDNFKKALATLLKVDLVNNISVYENGLDFKDLNLVYVANQERYPAQQFTEFFKNLYQVLFDEISKKVGRRIAASLYEKIYKDVHRLYGREITSQFIGVIPEIVLDESEALSFLGRTELEKRVLEKTKQLQELNDSLERKVLDRTVELKNTVESLEELNREQEASAKMLIRRDLELSRANEKLMEFDRQKSEFVTIAAHQLRTPLSGIKWILSMLVNKELGPLTDDQLTFIMKGYESNERMINLVDDMLNADRIDSGKYVYSIQPIQILDLFDNLLYEMIPIAKKKNISINFADRPTAIPKVMIDSDKMRAAIQNLLENAIKYTIAGGRIIISFHVLQDKFLEVAIADSGIGIPLEQQKNIFNRFFRARNAVKVETDGSGLGLFIVKGIIEKHGGRVWFESEENKGTTFHFTLKSV